MLRPDSTRLPPNAMRQIWNFLRYFILAKRAKVYLLTDHKKFQICPICWQSGPVGAQRNILVFMRLIYNLKESISFCLKIKMLRYRLNWEVVENTKQRSVSVKQISVVGTVLLNCY